MDSKDIFNQSVTESGRISPDSSGEIYYQAFRRNPVIIGISRISDGCYLEANESFSTILGYSREEIIGHTSFELNIWHDAGQRRQLLAELAEKKKLRGREVQMRTRDGRVLTFSASVDTIDIDNQACLLVLLNDITEKKLAQEELQHSEELFRLMAENAKDLVFRLSFRPEVRVEYISPSVLAFTGYTAEEHYRDYTFLFNLRHSGERMPNNDNDIVEKASQGREMLWTRKDGSLIWVEERVQPVFDSSGHITGMEGIIRDITERKQAEAALADEATRRRILVDQSRDGIVVLDQSGAVYEANRSFAEMLGYSQQEVMQLHVWDWEHQFDRSGLLQMLTSVDEKGSHFETTHRRKDGSYIDVEISGNGAVCSGQKLVFCVCRDITGRKQAEAALADEATRRRILVDQSGDGIVVLDQSGAVYEANRRFAEMLGYSQQEVVRLHVWDWNPDTPREKTLEILEMTDEKGTHFETVHRRKDGSQLNVEISANGAVCFGQKLIFCVCRDVTERKRMEQTVMGLYEKEKKQREELQEEARARGLFIDVLAHELRTPLTPILASTTILSDLLATSENGIQKRLAANIQNSAQTLAGRLEELLEMARYSRGTFKLKKKSTDINRFVEEVTARFKPTLEASKQQLRLNVPERLPQVELDRSRIEQVLINLLSNAVKFAPDKDITLEIKLDKNSLVFSVIDTGVGISVEEKNRIFQPYHRAEQDRQKFPGIGLGLAVCKQIIEAHGGRIWVKSERGQGSTFSFSLPVNPS